MKKLFLVLVVLLLAGCSLDNPLEPAEEATPESTATTVAKVVTRVITEVVTATPNLAEEVAEATPEPTEAQEKPRDFTPMKAYQDSLKYEVLLELRVPEDLLEGFTPVSSLVMNPDDLELPSIPKNLRPYIGFVDVEGVWGNPVAGYNDGNNWSCEDVTGWCADDIQAFNWRVITGYQVCHPAVGCLKDPDGGAVMVLFNNFHDSDEIWRARNKSGIFVDAGFIAYGPFWNHSRDTNDVEADIAAIRNHYLFQLGYPHPDNHLEGQCGSSDLCETVTYVVVYRMWDRPDLGIDYSHFQLVDWGQWVRP
jgi:hypothetical protein